jgi:hypothetical protein
MPRACHSFEPLRLRLARLEPQPFREIKRRLESIGFAETPKKEATSNSFAELVMLSIR